ncbi:MAG: biotin/lipoyl-containing protein, partial [Gallionella sp.]|nr:biotin/lipoyl-containing protein [Gallionella sp.]
MAELKQILVPDIGNFKDVNVIEVLVKTGDRINAEDSLISLETDKAAMDVPSPYSGVIKEIKIKAGDKVSQGSVILLLESGEAADAQISPPSPPFAKGGAVASVTTPLIAQAALAQATQTPAPETSAVPPVAKGG